jgi:hypothetical protein
LSVSGIVTGKQPLASQTLPVAGAFPRGLT